MTAVKPKICVIGVGWVGGAVARYFTDKGLAPRLYDPPKGLGQPADLASADVFFVCVPTPFDSARGGFDASFIEQAVSAVPGEGKLIVIKSTVLPGTTERLQRLQPRHRLAFNPEFLRQKTADADFRRPDRQIVGVTAQSAGDADLLLGLLPPAPFSRVLPAIEAETVKYFGNAFLALKVIYANQIFDLCRSLDIDYDRVRDCAAADQRIGMSHLDVHDEGYRGYGGGCLPKDVRALIQLADRLGVSFDLMKTCERINAGLVGSDGHL